MCYVRQMAERKMSGKLDLERNLDASFNASERLIFTLKDLRKLIEETADIERRRKLEEIFERLFKDTETIVASASATATGLTALVSENDGDRR